MKKTIFLILPVIFLASLAMPGFALASPQANAGADLYISSGQTATLQGSGYDQSGYALNYYWNCNGGTLSNYNVAQPTYTAPYIIQFNNQATYTCTLTVTNSYGASNSDSTTVYVNNNNNSGNNGSFSVQTNSATNISNNQATLNGYTSGSNSYNAYVWFQWGTSTNYGNNTQQQMLNYSGSFSQNIANLSYGTTYHFRAVAQGNYGTVYGQDITFTGNNSGTGYYGSGSLTVDKTAVNLSSGNLNWSSTQNASPSDIIGFLITLRAGGQDAHNVFVKDTLPGSLIYKNSLKIAGSSNYNSGDITSGINFGTIPAGQIVTISYQAQVAPAGNFSYGSSALNNNITATSNETGALADSATIYVSKTLVAGATYLPTGLTNNFFTDSFIIPLMLIVSGLWFYFSGKAYKLADRIKIRIRS